MFYFHLIIYIFRFKINKRSRLFQNGFLYQILERVQNFTFISFHNFSVDTTYTLLHYFILLNALIMQIKVENIREYKRKQQF